MKPYILEKHPKYFSWWYNQRSGHGKNMRTSQFMLISGFKFTVQNNDLVDSLTENAWDDYASSTAKELFEWADDNLNGRWGYLGGSRGTYYYFQDKEDTLKFILKYGCEKLTNLEEYCKYL